MAPKKDPTCHTCGEAIQWISKKGWAHWKTRENHSGEPTPHNAWPASRQEAGK